jgi:hypothetical protein
MRVHKILRPLFFRGTNSDHHTRLLLKTFFREFHEGKMHHNPPPLFSQKLEGNFYEKLLRFEDKGSAMCHEIFFKI